MNEFEGLGVPTAEPPKGVADLARVDDLPGILSGLLVMMAGATLSYTLVTTVRRRRRDLAILKTLGFERLQVRATLAWQATALVSAALAFAVPLGIAGGRWLWQLFADDLPARLLIANVLAAVPGRSAAATRPALILRSE